MSLIYTGSMAVATFRATLLRSVFFALLVLSAPLRAAEYIVPVSTGPINQKVYTTTIGIKNESASLVTCDWSYLERGGALRLTARDEVAPGQTLVHEDFASAAGIALGIARARCSGQVTIAARAQISEDGGATFGEPGRVFDGTPVAGPAASDTPAALAARSDLLFAEVGGKAVVFAITVKKGKDGDTIGQKRFEVDAYGLQIVNLASMRALASEVWVEVRVEGAGQVIAERITEDTKHTQIALRMSAESRARASQQQATKPAQTAAKTELRGSDPIRALGISSFKAAPFEDPLTGLVNMRNRWYSRETGSFLTPDPQGYADSANLYAYCGGDPVNCSDPTGESASLSQGGWIVATDNKNGGRLRRFSPQEIAQDPLAVRRFLGTRADVLAAEADALMTRAGYGAWINNPRLTQVARNVSAGVEDIGRHAASIYVSAIPGVGEGADARQAWTGYDPVAREELSGRDRIITAVGAALPVVTGKVLREALKSGTKQTKHLDETVIAGSDLRHLNGAIAEAHGFQQALARGQLPIQAPGKVTAPGVDYITFDPEGLGSVVVWDSKYRASGRFPGSIPAKKIQSWMQEAWQAVEALPEGPIKQKAREALAAGRVRGEMFKWPQ